MNNKVFYQHPNLMRALGMHETVMEVMVNVLGGGESKVRGRDGRVSSGRGVSARGGDTECGHSLLARPVYSLQEIRFPKMVTSCCRFLCYFCRISRQNQRSMFDHLSYLLENSGIGLGQISQGLGGYPRLHNKFEASLSYRRLCLRNSTNPKRPGHSGSDNLD